MFINYKSLDFDQSILSMKYQVFFSSEFDKIYSLISLRPRTAKSIADSICLPLSDVNSQLYRFYKIHLFIKSEHKPPLWSVNHANVTPAVSNTRPVRFPKVEPFFLNLPTLNTPSDDNTAPTDVCSPLPTGTLSTLV